MAEILHKIRIEAPIAKVYEAIATAQGVSKWWTKWASFTKGNGEVGSVLRAGFGNDKFTNLFEITQAVKNKTIEWKNLDEPGEWSWNGTKILFNFKEEVVEFYDNKKMTVVELSHIGFQKADSFYIECNTRWGFFLISLKDYIEKGKGMPVPDDIYM